MLTIGEMRARAGAFAKEWAGETREDAERQSFWNEWFEVFGIRRRRRVTFEQNVKKLSGTTGQIDAFWPGKLLVEHKSANDLVGVPGWLADIVASAYPSRSIEATTTDDGDMRITALELLGVTAPGVHDIEDLRSLYERAPRDLVLASGPDAAGDEFTVAVAAAAQPKEKNLMPTKKKTPTKTPKTAAATSKVDLGRGQAGAVFPDIVAQSDGTVHVQAADYRLMRALANAQADTGARRVREERLTEAVTAGQIPADEVPVWRAAWNLNPMKTRKRIDALKPSAPPEAVAASTPSTAAADAELRALLDASRSADEVAGDEALLQRSRARMATPGDAPASFTFAAPTTPVQAAATAPTARVTQDAAGRLSYAGLPVVPGADGALLVQTSAGALTVESVQAAGVDLQWERTLLASRVSMGEAT